MGVAAVETLSIAKVFKMGDKRRMISVMMRSARLCEVASGGL